MCHRTALANIYSLPAFNLYIALSMLSPPPWLKSFITEEALPATFESLTMDYCLPLAQSIVSWAQCHGDTPLVVGVNGAQGTGKSTLSKLLSLAIEHGHQLRCAIISIDDIYLTQQERADLAADVHPLLMTRGVPGTHDVSMGIELIEQLKNKKATQLPVFDKAIDDRAPADQWVSVDAPVDIIIFEGWCIGAQAQPQQALDKPCNRLEESEDKDASWRTYANEQLAGPYAQLFDQIDRLIMLKAPDFECVYQWRSFQEEKLRQRTAEGSGRRSIMNDEQIRRFIMHYERLTRWMFKEMPKRADCLLELGHDHSIISKHTPDR